MLHNLAIGSLIIAIFSSTCAFGVGKNLGRVMRPLMYGAAVVALVLFIAGYVTE